MKIRGFRCSECKGNSWYVVNTMEMGGWLKTYWVSLSCNKCHEERQVQVHKEQWERAVRELESIHKETK